MAADSATMNAGSMMGKPRTPPADAPDLEDLDRRLDTLRHGRLAQPPRGAAPPGGGRNAMGAALRLSTELVAGVVVGGGIGWVLDWLLNTGPVFLLVFFFLGAAAGIMTVMRTAREMNADAARSRCAAGRSSGEDGGA